tara:strand:- start:249 stop:1253 length:1005 start_codon:yes stop_codon:yes gene_type:complete
MKKHTTLKKKLMSSNDFKFIDLHIRPRLNEFMDFGKYHNRGYEDFDEAINKFIKTSEYDEYKPWFVDTSIRNSGFYLIDQSTYQKVINEIKKDDDEFRSKKINFLRENKPILFNTKKFKRTILKELEGRKILKPDNIFKVRDKLENLATYINLTFLDELDLFFEQFYDTSYCQFGLEIIDQKPKRLIFKLGKFESNKYKYFIPSDFYELTKEFLNTDHKTKQITTVNIKSNKMILFDNYLLTPRSYDHGESVIDCKNDDLKIFKKYDYNFEKTIELGQAYMKELTKKKLTKEQMEQKSPKGGRYYDRWIEKLKNIYLEKYKVDNFGNFFIIVEL